MSDYTLEYTAKLSGVPADKLEALAELYADPSKKVVSFWTMGFNQHTRGTWVNNMIYNVHLLMGKISEPGNGPFSLTGQPSACGTAREVGTFAHRLPADMVVTNPEHRALSEKLWNLPEGTIPDKIGLHAVAQSRALKDGKLKCYWTSTTNNMQAGPNINDEILPGWRNPETFVVVSDPYPTVSALAADLILPTAMWVEKEGAYGNAERRTQFWRQQVKAPGESRSDLWQYMEFSKRFKVEEVWPAELLAKQPEHRGKTLYDVLFANKVTTRFDLKDLKRVNAHAIKDYTNDESQHFGFYVQKGLFEEYAQFGRGHAHDLADFDIYHRARGLRWPVVDGKETLWRFREGYDPYVQDRRRRAVSTATRTARRTSSPCPTSRRRVAGHRVRPVAVHRPRAGTLAHRLDDPPGARAAQGRARGAGVHAPGRRQGARPAARHAGQDRVAARRSAGQRRNPRPQQAAARPGVHAVLRRRPAGQQAARWTPPARSRRRPTSRSAPSRCSRPEVNGAPRRPVIPSCCHDR